MEMGYRDHIVAKLSALAVAGGTTAMLFAATPVHTQFSATRKGSLSASGAKVALRLHNGYLNATNLLPATTASVTTASGTTTQTTYYPTNSQTVTLQNTGSVPETFTMIISKYACGSLASLQSNPKLSVTKALDQLQVNYTIDRINGKTPSSPLTGTVAPFARSGLSTLTCSTSASTSSSSSSSTSTSTTNTYTSVGSNPITIDLGTIKPSKFSRVTLSVQLAADSGVNANDWNGATGVEIPYTIQAEPDDAAATAGTPTGPTLSGSSTSAPTPSPTLTAGSQSAAG
jgi:hypothetical protein